MIGLLVRLLTGAGGLFEQLRAARKDVLEAANDADRIRAEVEVERLAAEIEARQIAKEVRLATAGQVEQRVLVFVAGFPPSAHFGAVCFDSMFPSAFPGWVVHALPAPMDQWQGAIILSLFGLSAVKLGAAVLARR